MNGLRFHSYFVDSCFQERRKGVAISLEFSKKTNKMFCSKCGSEIDRVFTNYRPALKPVCFDCKKKSAAARNKVARITARSKINIMEKERKPYARYFIV